jgi:hypothetical protein
VIRAVRTISDDLQEDTMQTDSYARQVTAGAARPVLLSEVFPG